MELSSALQHFFKGKDAFNEILNLEGEVFREHKNRRTLRIIRDGKGYFVKIHRNVGWKEIVKNLFNLRLPVLGAKNELRAIRRLEELGIRTMKAAGFGQRGIPPAWLDSFLITEELVHTTSLENFTRDWKHHPTEFRIKSTIIQKVADMARRLHQNGINHRDFYICHFLLDLASLDEISGFSKERSLSDVADKLKLYLIDLHRVQIRRQTPERWIIKDLAGLYFSSMDIGLTRHDVFRFIKAYRKRPLRNILKEEHNFWEMIRQRAIKLYEKERRSFQ